MLSTLPGNVSAMLSSFLEPVLKKRAGSDAIGSPAELPSCHRKLCHRLDKCQHYLDTLVRSNATETVCPAIRSRRVICKAHHFRLIGGRQGCGRGEYTGSCHKRQKPQAPMPQAPIRNRQTRKVTNAKGINRNTNLT